LPQVSDFLNFAGEQSLFVSVEQVVRQSIASLEAHRPLVIPILAINIAVCESTYADASPAVSAFSQPKLGVWYHF